MAHYEEFSSDDGTLKMVNHIGAHRIIVVFLVNVPQLSKSLQAVLPPDFKPTLQSSHVFTLDLDDEILPKVDDLLTQTNISKSGNELRDDGGEGKASVEPAFEAPFES